MKPPKAPSFLQASGKRFWRQAHSEKEFVESQDVARLTIGCRCLDELAADEATLRVEGRYTHDRHGRRIPHPALKTIQETRILYLRVVRELGLDLVPHEDPRQPRQYA